MLVSIPQKLAITARQSNNTHKKILTPKQIHPNDTTNTSKIIRKRLNQLQHLSVNL